MKHIKVFAILLALVNKKPKIEKDLLPEGAVEATAENESASAGEWWNDSTESVEEAETESAAE